MTPSRRSPVAAPRAFAFGAALAMLSVACGGASEPARDPSGPDPQVAELVRRGEASASLGDMTRAEQYFVLALKAGANEKKIVQRLLVVCVADQRYPVALEYGEQYLHRYPRDMDVQFAVASIYAAMGNVERARSMLQQIVQAEPTRSEVHYALATVLRQQGTALELADRHDLEYLRLNPQGPLAERARARLTKTTP